MWMRKRAAFGGKLKRSAIKMMSKGEKNDQRAE